MEFVNPKTKDEMYAVLYQLYNYYRSLKNGYEAIERRPLSLPKISFTPKTDEQLIEDARLLLAEKYEREQQQEVSEIEDEVNELLNQMDSLDQLREERLIVIEREYSESVAKIKLTALERGVEDSVTVEKIYSLEEQKNQAVLQLDEQIASQRSSIVARLEYASNSLGAKRSYLSSVHEKEVQAKMYELKKAQDEWQLEVVRFNNAQEEKEVKYYNALHTTNANLEISFMRVKAESLTREMLLEMGYYADVLKCINAYYDQFAPRYSYNDILLETDLMLFLDESYQNLIYQYKQRALDDMADGGSTLPEIMPGEGNT